MKTFSAIGCVMLMLLSGLSYGQFQHSYATEFYESGRSVQPTLLKKGYLVGGFTKYQVFGDYEATLIKTDLSGAIEWSAVYGDKYMDIFNSVRDVPYTSTPNIVPGYAALGSTRSFGFGGEDMYFVRTDLGGNPIFSRVFGGAGTDRGYCLKFIKDSAINGYGYVMVGETNSYPYLGGSDVYVVKTDEFGNLVRAVVIGGEGYETGYWIEQTRNQGYIIVGTTTSRTCGAPFANRDIFVIKLDQNLLMQWNAIIGGGSSSMFTDVAFGVVENPVDGSFTITGITQSFGVNNNGDAFLLNLKSTGAFNWMKTYGLQRTELGRSIHITRNPFTGAVEYVVGGYSTSYNSTGSQDAYVFKTDVNGNLLWTSLYGADGREVVSEITNNNERGYIFTGDVSAPWTYNNDDIYLVKMDMNGKSDSDCQIYVDQIEKRNDVCHTSSAQQVYVDDYKPVPSQHKQIDYKIRKCDPNAVSTLMEEPESRLAYVYSKESTEDVVIGSNSEELNNSLVKIFNMNGDLMLEAPLKNREIEVPDNKLPKGLYIVHFIKKDGTVVQKKFMK